MRHKEERGKVKEDEGGVMKEGIKNKVNREADQEKEDEKRAEPLEQKRDEKAERKERAESRDPRASCNCMSDSDLRFRYVNNEHIK